MKYLLKKIIRPLYYYLGNKNIREFYRLYDKWGEYRRYTEVDNIKVLSYTLKVPDLLSFIWQFKEFFVDESYKFVASTKTPIIYDCGANIGISCLYFKMLYPASTIKAFEADPNISKVLEENLQRNNCHDGVVVFNKAVWIDDNGIEFSCEGADGGSIYGNDNKIKLDTARLKSFLEQDNNIDLLKIDIEGAENKVLTDCKDSLSHVKHLFVEYHSWNGSNQTLSEVLQVFERNGFRYYIKDAASRSQPFLNKGENLNMDLQLNIFGVKR